MVLTSLSQRRKEKIEKKKSLDRKTAKENPNCINKSFFPDITLRISGSKRYYTFSLFTFHDSLPFISLF
jgi:hypothetical protein